MPPFSTCAAPTVRAALAVAAVVGVAATAAAQQALVSPYDHSGCACELASRTPSLQQVVVDLPMTPLADNMPVDVGYDAAPFRGSDEREGGGEAGRLEWAKGVAERFSRRSTEHGFFPMAGFVVTGSGLAAGGGYRDYHVAGTPLGFEAAGMVSYRRYQLYRLRSGLLGRRSDTMALASVDENLPSVFKEGTNRAAGIAAYGEATYRRFPERAFEGARPEGAGDDATYGISGASYDLVLQAQLSRSFAVSSRVGFFQPTVSSGERDGAQEVEASFGAEFGRQPDFVTFGVGATYDGRDNVWRPATGSFIGAAVWRFASRGGGFDFDRVALDVRHYATPFTPRGVLALRLLASSSAPSAGAHVPFYLQYTLGGGDALRGFASYRFRGNSLACLAAEYRWALDRFVDIVPFVEAASVAETLHGLRGRGVESSAGVGARLKWGEKTLLRFDWARSREGNRLVLGTGLLF